MTDQELIGYLDRLDQKIDGLREESRQSRIVLEEQNQQTRMALEEQNRQTREENQQARLVLEEQNRQTREENQQARLALEEQNRQTRVMMEGLRSEIQLLAEGVIGQGESFAFRHTEVLEKLGEVKTLVWPLYQDLNRRVRTLEERAERQNRDVMTVIRERFGKN